MISFRFHSEKWHEKNQKPLWFLVFSHRYLFRLEVLVAGGSGRLVVFTIRRFRCRPLNMAVAIFSRFLQIFVTLVLRRAGANRSCTKRKTCENAAAFSKFIITNSQQQKEKTHRLVCLSFFGCGRKIRTSDLRVMRADFDTFYAENTICSM